MRRKIFLVSSIVCFLDKAEPPKLVDKEEDYTGLASFFRMVKCNVDGEDLTYEWFHNGIKVEPTSTWFLLFGKFLATKDPVTEFHQGSYQCKASNKDGTLMGTEINVAFTSTCMLNNTVAILISEIQKLHGIKYAIRVVSCPCWMNNAVGPTMMNNAVGSTMMNNAVGPTMMNNAVGPTMMNNIVGPTMLLVQQ